MDTGRRAKTLNELEDENKRSKSSKASKKDRNTDKSNKDEEKGKGKDKGKDKGKGKDISKTQGDPDEKGNVKDIEEEKEPKIKKPHPARNTFFLTMLFWMLLFGAVIGMCLLKEENALGETKYLIDPEGLIRGRILIFLNADELGTYEEYESDIDSLFTMEDDLNYAMEEQQLRQEELDFRKKELEARERDLNARLSGLQNPDSSLVTLGATDEDLAALAKTLENMTPTAAAGIIENMNEDILILNILKLVKPKILGPILDALPYEERAEISTILAESLEE